MGGSKQGLTVVRADVQSVKGRGRSGCPFFIRPGFVWTFPGYGSENPRFCTLLNA